MDISFLFITCSLFASLYHQAVATPADRCLVPKHVAHCFDVMRVGVKLDDQTASQFSRLQNRLEGINIGSCDWQQWEGRNNVKECVHVLSRLAGEWELEYVEGAVERQVIFPALITELPTTLVPVHQKDCTSRCQHACLKLCDRIMNNIPARTSCRTACMDIDLPQMDYTPSPSPPSPPTPSSLPAPTLSPELIDLVGTLFA
ncbi:hypothetical protein FGB62_35g11 [Gracilaria domingensis]|nr:hypothetical protein FGB62_35g11 [Gracilaria domingensis]